MNTTLVVLQRSKLYTSTKLYYLISKCNFK